MHDNNITSPATCGAIAERASDKANDVIQNTRRAADTALDSLQDKASHLASAAPGTIGRVAARVEEMTRRGADRAKEATDVAREQVALAGDRTVSYIRDEPVKAVLVAAVAGAGIAALLGMVNRQRGPRL